MAKLVGIIKMTSILTSDKAQAPLKTFYDSKAQLIAERFISSPSAVTQDGDKDYEYNQFKVRRAPLIVIRTDDEWSKYPFVLAHVSESRLGASGRPRCDRAGTLC